LDAQRIGVTTIREPVPETTFFEPAAGKVRKIGELRLPIAGPYRPRARLFRYPDGRLLWLVRLWEYDRAVPYLLSTAALREFARINRLPRVRAEVDALVDRATSSHERP